MSSEFRTPDDLWNAVNAQLGYGLEPGIKTWLEKTGYVSAAMTAELPLLALGHLLQAAREAQLMIDAVLEDRKRAKDGSSRQIVAPERFISSFPDSLVVEEDGEQRDLLGLLIAKRMDRSKEVIQFRKEFLPNDLIDKDSLVWWIDQHAPHDVVRHQLFRTLSFVFDITAGEYVSKSAEMYYHDLYSSPLNEISPEHRIERVEDENGALGQLVTLALAIAEQTGWAFTEALGYILTGEPPALPIVRAFPVKILSDSGPRILMEVAMEASPEDVRTAYKLRRDKVYPRKRSKPLDDKTTTFVRFVLEQEDVDPDRPEDWQSIVTSWNNLPEVVEKSWQIESDERRRISNTYKRAIEVIESFSGGFDHEEKERRRRIAQVEAQLRLEEEYDIEASMEVERWRDSVLLTRR